MSSFKKLRHQGALEKQGKLKTWAWKKYWFSLSDAQLVYMKEEGKAGFLSYLAYMYKATSRFPYGSRKRTSSSHGEINMNEAQSVKECQSIHHGFPFQITTKTRTHILSAETSSSRQEWIDALQQAMLVKSRRSIITSENRVSTAEMVDTDDGAYEAITGASMTSSSSNTQATKPSLTKSQSEIEREPRCHSEYIDSGAYDAVFDAVTDQDLVNTTDSNDDEEDNYAEVVNAIHKGEGGASTWKNLKPKEEENKDSKPGQADAGPNSYSYVQMRTKTPKDYEQKSEGSMVDEYADVYGNSGNSLEDETKSNISNKDNDAGEEENKTGEATKEPYAKVIPKALRQTQTLESQSSAGAEEEYDDVEVQVRNSAYSSDDNNNAGNIPDLPYPRLELITTSAFDEIRRFLALNRGPTEVYKSPPSEDLDGKAVEKLRQMLGNMEDDNGVVLRDKQQDNGPRITDSTYL